MFRLCVLIIKSHCANVPKSEYMVQVSSLLPCRRPPTCGGLSRELQNHRKRVLTGEVSRGTFVPIIIETNEKKNSYAGTPRDHP